MNGSSLSGRLLEWRATRFLPLLVERILAACLVLGALVGAAVWYDGLPGRDATVEARLQASAGTADDAAPGSPVVVHRLGPGRFQVEAATKGVSRLVLDLRMARPGMAGGHLLIRVGRSGYLRSGTRTGAGLALSIVAERGGTLHRETVVRAEVEGVAAGQWEGPLILVPLDGLAAYDGLRIVAEKVAVEAENVAPGITIDEIGVAGDLDLFPPRSEQAPFLLGKTKSQWFHVLLPFAYFCFSALCVALSFLCRRRHGAVLAAACAVVLAFTVFSLQLKQYHSYPGRDLRAEVAAYHLKFPNLNYVFMMGNSLLRGEGLGVKTNRMPGYGLLGAAIGYVEGGTGNLSPALFTTLIYVQTLFFVAALGVFAWASTRIFPFPVVVGVSAFIAALPHHNTYTQVDALIVPCGLLISAAMALYLSKSGSRRPAPLRYHLLVHLAFALWFVFRVDVAPAWAVITIILSWRSWRMVLIPVALYLAIGLSWGAHKYEVLGQRFVMTTSSSAQGLFVGLWETPHKFVWLPSDNSFDQWISKHGLAYGSQEAQEWALPQLARFAVTYPGYMVSLVWHKSTRIINASSWKAVMSLHRGARLAGWLGGGPTLVMIGLFAFALFSGYQRRRTFLLGWPLVLHLPIFFFLYSSSRFHIFDFLALAVAVAPLVFEPGFRRRLIERPVLAGAVLAPLAAVWLWGTELDQALLGWDGFRYATPFLDPARSTLSVFK